MYKNGLIKKNKVNFKFYDVTAWLTNTYCPISREVKITRQ